MFRAGDLIIGEGFVSLPLADRRIINVMPGLFNQEIICIFLKTLPTGYYVLFKGLVYRASEYFLSTCSLIQNID